MESVNIQSAKSLAWSTGTLIALSLAIMSPSGAFALLVLAAICVVIPSAFSAKRIRLIFILLLITSIAMAASFYPEFIREQGAYRQHANDRAAKAQITTPTDQGDNGQGNK